MFDLIKEELDRRFRVIVFDNFYTSFRLVRDLLEQKTFCCGTVRTDRGLFPAKFKMKSSKEDKKIFVKDGNIFAIHWKDNRDVFLMSSCHGTSKNVVERYNDDMCKPEMVIDYYYSKMTGVISTFPITTLRESP